MVKDLLGAAANDGRTVCKAQKILVQLVNWPLMIPNVSHACLKCQLIHDVDAKLGRKAYVPPDGADPIVCGHLPHLLLPLLLRVRVMAVGATVIGGMAARATEADAFEISLMVA